MNIKKPKVEEVEIKILKPHPRNYRDHPDDQLAHLIESLKTNGFYRNVIIAKDNTILAGHGIIEAAKKINVKTVPAIRLNIKSDSAQAKKILIGDNESGHLAEINDRLLTEILKEIKVETDNLLSTGFDEKMLANLVYISRDAKEIEDFDEAAEWVGMPEYENPESRIRLIVSFRTEEDKAKFAKMCGFELKEKTLSVWWPFREREDLTSLKFEQ
jgi:ParB-like chromosome segregation protein Spo0J